MYNIDTSNLYGEELECEDCGIIHPGMSCYKAEQEFGKKCNL